MMRATLSGDAIAQLKSIVHALPSLPSRYHHIVLNGEEYHLGDVQASIVEQLHDAYRSRNQWVHGKTLLFAANSKAVRLRDVFKSKNDWTKIVASNGRGYYRLNLHEQSALHIDRAA